MNNIIEILLSRFPEVVPMKLPKKYFGADLDAILFPQTGTLVLVLNLSNEEDDKLRIQPFDLTLYAIKNLKNNFSSLQAIVVHDDFVNYVYLSDLSFVSTYTTAVAEEGKRRSIRISKPSLGDIEKIKNSESVIPTTNLLSGSYISLDLLISKLAANIISKGVLALDKPADNKYEDPFCVVYYGPPGTGKTKTAQYICNKILKSEKIDSEIAQIDLLGSDDINLQNDNFYATQFHPSFTYEDFIEGLRPIQVQNSDATDIAYLVTPGILKVVSQLARAFLYPEIYGIEIDAQFVKKDVNATSWDVGENSLNSAYRFKDREGYFLYKDKKVMLTGKTQETLNVEEGVEPEKTGMYKLVWYSLKNQNQNFILFIDELNRGNPAAVFGEALSLLETTKRINQKEQAFLTLPYSKKSFGIPSNLHIVCAMNSSDKSLISLDQAFRRRFKFHYIAPDFSLVMNEKFIQLIEGAIDVEYLKELQVYFEAINKSLKDTGISEDNFIGHSYMISFLRKSFLQIKNDKKTPQVEILQAKLKELWRRELHSLLRDIVGEFKIEEFSNNLFTNLTKLGETKIFGSLEHNYQKKIREFLNDPAAKNELYPWKQSA